MIKSARILLIDNYDSFTYNLVQGFSMLGVEVLVFRNDQISLQKAKDLKPTHLVISPGPGRPDDAGQSVNMIDLFMDSIPILGVCLGHQCLIQYFGGTIVSSKLLMHGKMSQICHDDSLLFKDIPQGFEAGRYHSLCADKKSIPEELIVSATTHKEEIMGVRHKDLPLFGVQFHPESILTPLGYRLMENFIT